jgi:diguanylate cyclase (GGDEF)-like protein
MDNDPRISDPEQSSLPPEMYEAAARELDLPVDHKAVDAVILARFGENLALEALNHIGEKLQETKAKLETYRRDPMTNLLLRRAYIEETDAKRQMVHENAAAGANGHNTALMVMLDLKRLHTINEKGGHASGDNVITGTGEGLLDMVDSDPDMDITPGRLGGDEFAVLVTFDNSLMTVEQVQDSIFAKLNKIGIDRTPYGLRVGDAALSSPDKTVIDLFKEADPKAPKSMKQKLGKFLINLTYSAKRQAILR